MHLQAPRDGPHDALLPTGTGGFISITQLLPREATDSCHPHPNMNLCEKPTISSSSLFIALVIVSIVCLTGFFCFLWYLHRKRTRLDKMEDLKDPQELDDYGIASHSRRPTSQWSGMPKVPPPVVQSREKNSTGGKVQSPVDDKRASQDSLTPSLRQAMGVAPRDPFANR